MNEPADTDMMRAIDDGTLRAYLDNDPVLDDAARARIAAAIVESPTLAERLSMVRADVLAVDATFAALTMPEADAAQIERAYHRVQTRLHTERYTGFIGSIKERLTAMSEYNNYRAARVRRFAFAGTIAAVALVAVLVFAPVGSVLSAALDKFRYQPTQFAVITINASQFPQFAGNAPGGKPSGTKPTGSKPAGAPNAPNAQDQQQLMQELAKYVTVTSSMGQGQQLPGREVAGAAEAQKVAGRAVTTPKFLPPGVANTPKYYVSDHQTADATLHLNEIRPALAQAGMGALLPPTGDSATVHVDAPAGSIVSYGFDPTAQGAAAQNQKGVAVIALGSPTIDVQGLDVQSIVTLVGAMPGFPPDLAAQLKKADLQHTLIVPVTNDQIVKNGNVNGAPSTTISQKDGSMSVVLWITKDTVMHIAVGTFGPDVMEQVAKSI